MKTQPLADPQETYRERVLEFLCKAANFQVRSSEERNQKADGKKLGGTILAHWFDTTQVNFIAAYISPDELIVNFSADFSNYGSNQITFYFKIIYEPF